MFDFFKWHKLKKEIKASVKKFEERNMDISEILEIDDADCLVDEMRTYIYEKCDYGSCTEKLSHLRRLFYCCICFVLRV